MNEKPESPWSVEPNSEREHLEFQRQMLAGLRTQLHEFARTEDITYEIEQDDEDALKITVDADTREAVREYLEKLIEHANGISNTQKQSYEIGLVEREDTLILCVKRVRNP